MPSILITGASSGIGEEFATQFAKKGRSLILVARSEDRLNKFAISLTKKFSIQVDVICLDLGLLDSADQLFNKCLEKGLDVDLLINNAGIGQLGQFNELDYNKMQEMLILNMITLTKLSYLFFPHLQKNQGAILNVASEAAFLPTPNMTVYGATKAYVLSFTEALRVDLENTNVRVVALCPGPTLTNFLNQSSSSKNPKFKFRTTEEVVKKAIKGLENNKGVTFTGWDSKLRIFFMRFMSRSFLAHMSKKMLKNNET